MEDVGSYTDNLISRFARRGILVDTNLLLLYAVGAYEIAIVERGTFDRVSAYTVEDLQLLRGLLSLFDRWVTTPHVLAEVSNWIGYLPRTQKAECLAQFSHVFSRFTELPVHSLQLSEHQRFPFLGLTDTAIAEVSRDYLVLTDDARLVGHINEMGLDALNINHLRQELWLRE